MLRNEQGFPARMRVFWVTYRELKDMLLRILSTAKWDELFAQ